MVVLRRILQNKAGLSDDYNLIMLVMIIVVIVLVIVFCACKKLRDEKKA